MKFSTPSKTLIQTLTRCCGMVATKSPVPILGSVCIVADANNTVTFRATDLNLALSITIEAEVKEPGSVCLEAKGALEKVRALPVGDVSVSVDAKCQADLKSSVGHRKFRVRGLPGEDFPPPPDNPADEAQFIIESKVLSSLIAKTEFSVCPDDTRPHMAAILFSADTGVLCACSTDGHRLSKAESPWSGPALTMLLPRKGVCELRKLLVGANERVELTLKGVIADFDLGFGTLSIKTVENPFPSYEGVMAWKSEEHARVPRTALAESLGAVCLASSEHSYGIDVLFEAGTMRVSSESDSASGADEIPADYSGPERSFGVYAKYMIDVLTAIDTEEVDIGFGEPIDPIVIKPVGGENCNYVVMPVSKGTPPATGPEEPAKAEE